MIPHFRKENKFVIPVGTLELPMFCLSAPLCCQGFSIFFILNLLFLTRASPSPNNTGYYRGCTHTFYPIYQFTFKVMRQYLYDNFWSVANLISFGFFLNCFEVISEEACDADRIFYIFWASAVFRFRASCQSCDQHSTHSIRAQHYWSVCFIFLEVSLQRNVF
jgi:hypothetical protein